MYLICTRASVTLGSSVRPIRQGPTSAASMARMTITTMISIRVKPPLFFSLFIEQHPPFGLVLLENECYMKGLSGTRFFDLPGSIPNEIYSASIEVLQG